jgi:FkbH-like protein
VTGDGPVAEATAARDAILAWLAEKPSLARTVGAARQLENLHGKSPGLFVESSVLVIRNFTLEPVEPLLKLAAFKAGAHLSVTLSGYGPSLDEVDDLLRADPGTVVLAYRLEEISPALTRDFLAQTAPGPLADAVIDQIATLVRRVRATSRAAVLVHNLVAPISPAAGLGDPQRPDGQINLVRTLNVRLADLMAEIDGAYLVDVDHEFGVAGVSRCFDERGERVSDAPLSPIGLEVLARSLARHIQAVRGPRAKCVVVDCDNTLWAGVVGEDGLAGIEMGDTGPGRRHRDLQRHLLDLRRRGVLLAICSRNEEADVLEVLRSHPDCVLREDDFAALRVNWEDKADNVVAIAAELNLSTGHLVFVDDDPMQCEWVASRLPDVTVLRWPEDTGPRGSLDDLALFDSLVTTDEDRSRTEMYRAESHRRAEATVAATPEGYLASLDLRVAIGPVVPARLGRVAQLTQRTNQFNLTTRRYEVAELTALADDESSAVLTVSLQDRFGSYGLVGCGVVRCDGPVAEIDSFLLSCRVLGRHVEAALANRLAAAARRLGATQLVGTYVPSARNGQVANLYERLGFDTLPGERARWQWDLVAGDPPVPAWLTMEDAEEMDRV